MVKAKSSASKSECSSRREPALTSTNSRWSELTSAATEFTARCRILRTAGCFRADLHPDLKADFILADGMRDPLLPRLLSGQIPIGDN